MTPLIDCEYSSEGTRPVVCLSLVRTAYGPSEDDAGRARFVVTRMADMGVHAAPDLLIPRWFTDEFIRTEPAIVEARRKQLIEMDPDIYLNTFRIYAETEMALW